MTHDQYVQLYLNKKIDYDKSFGYQCVDLARDYCAKVWEFLTKAFGGSAIAGWTNRGTTFPGKRYITGFPNDCIDIKEGDIVIFKPNAQIQCKRPGGAVRETIKFTKYGHVAILHDYIDNDGVLRCLEQNGGKGSGTGTGTDTVRIYGYKGKDAIAGFILQ